jgi:hypothetical protein
MLNTSGGDRVVRSVDLISSAHGDVGVAWLAALFALARPCGKLAMASHGFVMTSCSTYDNTGYMTKAMMRMDGYLSFVLSP